jgi:uncharacterized membrane protein
LEKLNKSGLPLCGKPTIFRSISVGSQWISTSMLVYLRVTLLVYLRVTPQFIAHFMEDEDDMVWTIKAWSLVGDQPW